MNDDLSTLFSYRAKSGRLFLAGAASAGGALFHLALVTRQFEFGFVPLIEIINLALLSVVAFRCLMSTSPHQIASLSLGTESLNWRAMWPYWNEQSVRLDDITHILVKPRGDNDTLIVRTRDASNHVIRSECFGGCSKQLVNALQQHAPHIHVLNENNWLHKQRIRDVFAE